LEKMQLSRNGAFTLIELLVVIAVIGILAALLFPVFARCRERARQAQCLSNLRQIGVAMIMYADDYDGFYPTSQPYYNWESHIKVIDYQTGQVIWLDTPYGSNSGSGTYKFLVDVLQPYMKNLDVWYCPSDRDVPEYESRGGPKNGWVSYIWFPRWIWNDGDGVFPDVGPNLDVLTATSEPERIMFGEKGIFGWDGPKPPYSGEYNHPNGYNALFNDGHVKLIRWDQRRWTVPATHW